MYVGYYLIIFMKKINSVFFLKLSIIMLSIKYMRFKLVILNF